MAINVTKMSGQLDDVRKLADRIGRQLRFMEVCGTHTMAIFRTGIRSLLPDSVILRSGPGCPVCVTPTRVIDQAVALARRPGNMLVTYGDMLRVPGTETSLELERARGGDVRIVYSAQDALELARKYPDRKVVFLAVGFETTAPATAWVVREACGRVPNFRVLCAHKTIPRAMAALVQAGEVALDGFLCPGHVSVIIGSRPYEFLARDHRMPCVIAGFEADDIIAALAILLKQVAAGRSEVEIQYTRSVRPYGNRLALAAVDEIMEPCAADWRGLGIIPGSGLALRPAYAAIDILVEGFETPLPEPKEPQGCRCGEVLRGVAEPSDCGLFGRACAPGTPVGPCMVSSEGACAAYFKYGRSMGAP